MKNFILFFTNILDITAYIQVICFSLCLLIIDLPKEINKKEILLLIFKFIGLFGAFLLVLAVFFTLDSIATNNFVNTGGRIFMFAYVVTPIIYTFIFLKEDFLHKILKAIIISTSFFVINEISSNIGRIIGTLTKDDFVLVVIFRALPYLFSLVMALMIKKYDIKRFKKLPTSIVVIICIISCLLLLICVLSVFLIENTMNSEILFTIIYSFLLVVLILAYYTSYKIINDRHRLIEKEVEASMSNAERESIKVYEQNREEISIIRHDLKNQLSYLCVLIEQNNFDDACKYLNEILNKDEKVFESFSCANKVISSIINLELTKAKVRKVKIKVEAVVPYIISILDSDLCSIIMNIIDNALENFQPNSDDDFISVSISTLKDYLRIICINSVRKTQNKIDILRSNKKDYGHGYGVKIIKSIANKYNGHASFYEEDDKFVCDVIISLSNEGDTIKNA